VLVAEGNTYRVAREWSATATGLLEGAGFGDVGCLAFPDEEDDDG
jgi:hypothetical protein